jgi:hypothetical protein
MKKWFKRIALGVLIAFVILYGFLMVRSSIPATVNDKELQFPRASIPAGSNAFDVLQATTNTLWWPEEQMSKIADLAKDTNWDDALANTVLASNREALAGWGMAAKLPDLQVPEVSTANDVLPYLAVWKRLAMLAGVRENVLLHNGQDKEAFDQIVNHVQLGQRMQNSHGVLIVYLVGASINNMGLSQMQHWVGKTHLTPDQLEGYILQLKPQPDETAMAFANAIRVEHQMQIDTMDALRKGKMTNSESGGYSHYPYLGSVLPVFNFSQTKALYAKGALMLVQAAPHHYNEANIAEMESRPTLTSMFLSGNAVGQILYYMMMPAVIPSLAKKSQADVSLQATRIILALRAYQLTHGNLPANLNALVPEFLDAVPIDDFDGQPLHYSVEKKIVYSVGKNLKDDGGDDQTSPTDPSQRHLDLVYKFDF